MTTDVFMVITDQSGALLAGESALTVFDPYLKKSVARPVELTSFGGDTANTFTFGGSGGGSAKVVFNPFTITKKIDATSSTLFLAQAKGLLLKYVDVLFLKPAADGSAAGSKPYLSYRLGAVGISDIATGSDDEGVTERVSFEFGQLQIGYQVQKPDGTYAAFAPVGWDRVKGVQI